MPYKNPEQRRKHNREYMRKVRANQSIEVTDELQRLREKASYPEHEAFGYVRQKRTIESALNPIPMQHKNADNPEAYGERGTDMTNQNDPDIYNALHPLTEAEKQKKKDENDFQNQVEEQRKLS